MTRLILIPLLVAFGSAGPATAQTPDEPPVVTDRARTGHPQRTVAADPIRAMLLNPVGRVNWYNAPLQAVFVWLRAQRTPQGTANVVPRWRALGRVGIDAETPITLELEDVTVAEVLDEVFDLLSGRDPIVYQQHGNVLRVSPLSDFRRKLDTRIYNIAEILAKARAARIRPGIGIGQQTRVGRATGTPGAGVGGVGEDIEVGTTILGDVDNDNDRPDDNDEIIEKFIHWIKTTIEPDTWDVNGGPGTLAVFDGMLIVRNAADVHDLLQIPFDAARR